VYPVYRNDHEQEKRILIMIIYNIRQSDVKLSPLALPCSRITLVQGGVYCRALHRVPIPMPMGFGWACMGEMLLFMGGHRWASVMCIPASSFKSESNFSNARNTLTKKRCGLKPRTIVNNLLFIRSNQNLVYAGNTHYTIFEYMGAI
jgi:hypothetical protein